MFPCFFQGFSKWFPGFLRPGLRGVPIRGAGSAVVREALAAGHPLVPALGASLDGIPGALASRPRGGLARAATEIMEITRDVGVFWECEKLDV